MSDGAFAVLGYNTANQWLQGQMEARARQARASTIRSIQDDLKGRVGQDPKGVAMRMGDLMGMTDDDTLSRTEAALRDPANAGRLDSLIRRVAYESQPGLAQQVRNTLAREDWQGQAARGAMVTGIAGGGVMGGVALTEAGQQLLALIRYAEETEDTAAKREEAPIA